MESKGKDTTALRDETFLCEMAFLCDITSHSECAGTWACHLRYVQYSDGIYNQAESVGDADTKTKLEPLTQLPDHEREALYCCVPECTVC